MQESQINNKRIAKNTLLLYLRMFLTMAVGLFTSRVVLQTLGVSDYGVYNIVGGFVSMLAYMNSVFVAASQRFLSFALGKGKMSEPHRVFCTSVSVHFTLAIIIFIFAETFGLWFVNAKLVIDPERLTAANWVFQCSIISLMIEITGIPYNASIVAHERMNVYAYMSIFNVLAKLGIVYALWIASWDKLIVYAILMTSVSAFTVLMYIVYCKKKFEECHFSFILDKPLLKEMSSYAGWTAVGTLGFTFKDQVINIIINLFYGSTVNAARGVAVQVNGIVNQFSTNFFMAVSPQITKRYASGEMDSCRELVYASSKFAFFLLAIIIIPLSINLGFILDLWLDEVPQYTLEFLELILFSTMVGALSSSSGTAIQATGKIKTFQKGISLIFLTEIPLAYLFLKNGCAPYYVVMPCLFTQLLGVIFRFWILKRQISGYSLRYFMLAIVGRSILTMLCGLSTSYYIRRCMNDGIWAIILSTILAILITTFIIYIIGLTNEERSIVTNFIKRKLTKNNH